MSELSKIEDAVNFVPPQGYVVVFYTKENNNIVLKAKKSDGTIVNVLSSYSGNLDNPSFDFDNNLVILPEASIEVEEDTVIVPYGTISGDTLII